MKRRRWLVVATALVLVGWFVGLPQVERKMLRDQCAKDGGTLDASGGSCQLPTR